VYRQHNIRDRVRTPNLEQQLSQNETANFLDQSADIFSINDTLFTIPIPHLYSIIFTFRIQYPCSIIFTFCIYCISTVNIIEERYVIQIVNITLNESYVGAVTSDRSPSSGLQVCTT
jgi:hypothetical protein